MHACSSNLRQRKQNICLVNSTLFKRRLAVWVAFSFVRGLNLSTTSLFKMAMKFILYVAIFLSIFAQVRSLVCKKCVNSAKGACTEDQQCKTVQTRCLAVYWGPKAKQNPNKYTMRCATPDECSDSKRNTWCPDKDNCEARCCDYDGCRPFQKRNEFVEVSERTFRCHRCQSETLDSCLESEQLCDDDQDACVSFLMEGGNLQKVYTKRCARKDECLTEERERLCALEKDQSQRKKCQSSCCFFELCNQAGTKTVSLAVVLVSLAFAILS